MNLTMYECVNDSCGCVVREFNIWKEFQTYIITIIIFITIIVAVHLRYKWLEKKKNELQNHDKNRHNKQ